MLTLVSARRTSDLAASRHEGVTVIDLPKIEPGIEPAVKWTDASRRSCPPCTGNCSQGRQCNAGREPGNGTSEVGGAVAALIAFIVGVLAVIGGVHVVALMRAAS